MPLERDEKMQAVEASMSEAARHLDTVVREWVHDEAALAAVLQASWSVLKHHRDALAAVYAAGGLEGYRAGHRDGWSGGTGHDGASTPTAADDAGPTPLPPAADRASRDANHQGAADESPDPFPPHVMLPLRQAWDRLDAIVQTAPPDLRQQLSAERGALHRCMGESWRGVFDFGFFQGIAFVQRKMQGQITTH